MGSRFSGWYGERGHRPETDDFPALDIRLWQRQGVLRRGITFSVSQRERGRSVPLISVKVGRDNVSVTDARGGYSLRLAWTPVGLGGRRAWLVCPSWACHRRACVLYRHSSGYACRVCLGLAHRVERETRPDRAERRELKQFCREG